MEARKEDFRQYLEDSGVISALTKALIKLYELKYDRPESAVAFIQQHMTDTVPTSTEYQNLVKELEDTKAQLAALTNGASVITDLGGMAKEALDENHNVIVAASTTSINGPKSLLEKLHADATCNSLVKKYLTMEMFESLQDKKTISGKTLLHCINAGLKHPSSSVGIYAADADAYDVFAEIFNPIIADYHKFEADKNHPEGDGWAGDVEEFVDLDPEHKYIKSTRIRCARSMAMFPLNPAMSEKDYLNSMKEVTDVLATLTGELEGKFYALEGMDEADKEKMIEAHQLFKSGDKHLKDADALNFWPKGRGIFKNAADTFLVWVNEEDHLRFISMDQSGDVKVTYNRLKDAVTQCSSTLQFKQHARLGWLTFCPTNLGSTIRASVMIELPNLTAKGNLKELADQFHLQIRGTHGEHSETVDGLYEISNKRRLGVTEFNAVKDMYVGIKQILEAEVAST